MSSKLKISDELSLPLQAVTETFAIMGMRGSGKTTTGKVMVEEMLKAGVPVVIYDPVGVWWGLKTSADGKQPGFPVNIFGGRRADVPLEVHAAETIARVIIEKRVPAILDCRLLNGADRIRFMTKFCQVLYYHNREPLHFFVDEAHTIAPQNIRSMPEASRLLGSMEEIILQGRQGGLGMTVISQRPALLNATIRNQCATLIAMRMTGPHDLKAIRGWTDAHGSEEQAAELMKTLPTLKTGEGWVWSPAFLDMFKRVGFRAGETFDSSATPKVGQKVQGPKAFAAIDVAALGAEITAAVEKVKAEDPKLLRAELAKTKAELAKAMQRPEPTAKVQTQRVEVPVLKDGQLAKLEGVAEKLAAVFVQGDELQVKLRAIATEVVDAVHRATSPAPAPRVAPAAAPAFVRASAERAGTATDDEDDADDSPASTNGLPKGEHKILTAAAQYADGVSKETLTVLTGFKRSSRNTYIQRLSSKGLVDAAGENVTATAAGMEALGPSFKPLPTGAKLLAHWRKKLPTGELAVLDHLVAAGGEWVDRETLDEPTGFKRSSRNTYLQRLGARRLIESGKNGAVRASGMLFG